MRRSAALLLISITLVLLAFVPALLLFTVVGAFHLLISADKYSV